MKRTLVHAILGCLITLGPLNFAHGTYYGNYQQPNQYQPYNNNPYGTNAPTNPYQPPYPYQPYQQQLPTQAPYYPPANQMPAPYGYQQQRPIQQIAVNISGYDMPKLDIISKSDPYLKFFGVGHYGHNATQRTHTCRNCSNPNWGPFTLDVMALTGGNLQQPIMVEVWDEDRVGHDDKIGYFYLNLQQLMTSNVPLTVNVIKSCHSRRMPRIVFSRLGY